jgi:sporulation protein YlmC with PRC-barrel domain
MKMNTRFSALSALALASVIGVTGVLWAGQQERQESDRPDIRVHAGGVDVVADVERQRAQSKAVIFRASALIGMNVQNAAEKELGEIHDLTINGNTGEIEYAAISFGGFAGVGDKLFAVPWEAMQLKQVGEREDDKWVAVMDVTKETLEASKGFNKENWPESADDRTFPIAERQVDTIPRR